MTCIAMQPLITSCCYEGMRMLHAVRPAQLRRPRDGAAGIRAAPEGRPGKEAAAAHPAATRQGTVVGWPPRRCGKMAGQAFLCFSTLFFFLSYAIFRTPSFRVRVAVYRGGWPLRAPVRGPTTRC